MGRRKKHEVPGLRRHAASQRGVVTLGGRDHWNFCYGLMLLGGGIRGGYVHGASDRQGAFPQSKPVTPADIIATIYHCLGIPADLELHDNLARPYQLVPWGKPIAGLLA